MDMVVVDLNSSNFINAKWLGQVQNGEVPLQEIQRHDFYNDPGLNEIVYRMQVALLKYERQVEPGKEVLGLYQLTHRKFIMYSQHNANTINLRDQGASRAMRNQPVGSIIAIHNHPNNQYFSVGDVHFWAGNESIRDFMVITDNCKYQAMLKKMYTDSSEQATDASNQISSLKKANGIKPWDDADRIIDLLSDIGWRQSEYKIKTFINYL